MAKHAYLDTLQVEYDPENPRITGFLEAYEDVNHDLIGQALSPGDKKFLELKQAIRSSDGIINPIIVNKLGDRYITIEGNTRLAIYKQFNKEDPDDDRWNKVPALVYDDMKNRGVDAIRLQAHLVGVRNWSPYAKAKYLYTLHQNDRLPIDALVDFCGGNKMDVLKNIGAFKQMEYEYRPAVPEEQFDDRKFSLFFHAQQPKFKEAITRAGFTNKHFIEWVVKDKFSPRQEYIRELPKILKSPRAREAFLAEGAESAIRYLDRPELAKELLEANLVELCFAVQTKIKDLKLQERDDIRDDDDSSQCIEDTYISIKHLFENEIYSE